MRENEFIQMAISERIAAAVEGKIVPVDKKVTDQAEKIIWKLKEKKRVKLEEYINQLISSEADVQVQAYIGGFRDGVLLMKEIGRIEKENRNGGNPQ